MRLNRRTGLASLIIAFLLFRRTWSDSFVAASFLFLFLFSCIFIAPPFISDPLCWSSNWASEFLGWNIFWKKKTGKRPFFWFFKGSCGEWVAIFTGTLSFVCWPISWSDGERPAIQSTDKDPPDRTPGTSASAVTGFIFFYIHTEFCIHFQTIFS